MHHLLVGLGVLGFVLTAGASCAQPEAEPLAPSGVQDTGIVVLHDDARDKDLQLRVRAPEPDDTHTGPFPMIVFSHGMGGSSGAFAALSEHLAAHGYVVVHPTHSDSVSLGDATTRRERARALLRDPAGSVAGVDLGDRVADVKFLLDSIDKIEGLLGAPVLVDREHLGMAGHSAGAMTTQALGGLEFFAGRRSLGARLAEPRLDAFAVISGRGTNRRSLTEESWRSIDRPWLVITGSEDVSRASDETPESRRHPYEYAPADGTKYLLFIEGATHSSYQGRVPGLALDARAPENLGWIGEVTNESVLTFFDAYLKGSVPAREGLDAGEIVEREGGELQFLHK